MAVQSQNINQARPKIYKIGSARKTAIKKNFMQRIIFIFFVLEFSFIFSWSAFGQNVSIKDSVIAKQQDLIKSYEVTFLIQKEQIKSLENFADTLFIVNICIIGILIIISLLTVLGVLDKHFYK
jgi:hypothetical protein